MSSESREPKLDIKKNPLPAVETRVVGVKYKRHRKREDIKTLVYNFLLRRVRKDEFWALKEISFAGFAGEIIGIIGYNGAGKTTLCKVISRLIKPDRGEVFVSGEVSALLSLGTGFNSELSGTENIYLNGMMLGISKKEIEEKYKRIVEFSGLEEFINEPIKYYSKGMKARLGFSIAAMIEPEILVLDEALSAGDIEFNARATAKTRELLAGSKVVIIVSHDIDYVEKNCNKAIWIEKGEIKASGESGDVCSLYRSSVEAKKANRKAKKYANFKKTRSTASETIAVKAENLGVKFKLNHKTIWALKDVSFEIREGEVVGIIGPNGAGKTTLCRVLGGLLRGDEGTIQLNGEISSLLSLGAGFNKLLPGRDNIFLNGLMLGLTRNRISDLYDEIVEFSELESFIDTPVKYYSSGMISRLGFSIASAIEPDIFIIDEALSAGDASFHEKASERIQEMIEMSKAVVVVTHSLSFVKNVCNRAILMKDGRIHFDGKAKDAVKKYRDDVARTGNKKKFLMKRLTS